MKGEEEIIAALERLEQKLHDSDGYKVDKILFEMNLPISGQSKHNLRVKLRKLMNDATYKNPSGRDIVYTPGGWDSGTYRLSKYRGN